MAVRAVDLYARLQEGGLRIFTSTDVRVLGGLDDSAAAQALRRLAGAGLVIRLKRGVWAQREAPGLGLFEAVGHLAAPWPAYVSLHSALARSGLIAEIPHRVSAVSPGPSRNWVTPLGTVDIHHLARARFFGYAMEREGGGHAPFAGPEKAFLDTLYLSLVPRSPVRMPVRRDGRWPLNRKILKAYAKRFAFPPLTERLRALHLI